MNQREMTAPQYIWLLAKCCFWGVAWPPMLLVSLLSFTDINHFVTGDNGMPIFIPLIWAATFLPLIHYFWNVNKRRRAIKQIVASMKGELFNPQKGNEVYEGWQNYLGVDAIRGTLLYVRMTRKGQFDVVGLDMNSWTRIAREGKTLRLNTKMPECPAIEIATSGGEKEALHFYDVICAMEHRVYDYQVSFPLQVKQKTENSENYPGIQLTGFA